MGDRKPRPLVAGNWKMNGVRASLALVHELKAGWREDNGAELLVCPPATLIHAVAEAAKGSGIAVGGQDAHWNASGPHTGDIAPEMLADLGATYVILGHSERRMDHREPDQVIRRKADAARRAGLTAIVCVGETREEREAGRALQVVASQLRGSVPAGSSGANLVIAYEPVWAIGTGLVPTAEDIREMHAMIRGELAAQVPGGEVQRVRILYGGSVKPSNASELLAIDNVDGALVGGASLVARDFLAIAEACPSG